MKRSVKEQESRKGMKVEEIFAALDMLEKGTLDVILTVDKIINRPYWERAHMLDTEICLFLFQ